MTKNKHIGGALLWVIISHPNQRTTEEKLIRDLYHAMQRLGIYKKAPSKKKESEPNEGVTGEYPGEKIQVDVKYVPKKCMSLTYVSSEFERRLVKYFQFKIKTIQTEKNIINFA